jgi:hypothetical protein
MYKSMRKKLKEAGEEDVANCNHEKALEKQWMELGSGDL